MAWPEPQQVFYPEARIFRPKDHPLQHWRVPKRATVWCRDSRDLATPTNTGTVQYDLAIWSNLKVWISFKRESPGFGWSLLGKIGPLKDDISKAKLIRLTVDTKVAERIHWYMRNLWPRMLTEYVTACVGAAGFHGETNAAWVARDKCTSHWEVIASGRDLTCVCTWAGSRCWDHTAYTVNNDYSSA